MSIQIDGLPREVRYFLFDFDGTLIDLRPKWWQPLEDSFVEIIGRVPEDNLRSRTSEIMASIPQEPSKLFLLKVLWEIGDAGNLSFFQKINFVRKAGMKFTTSRYINQLIPGVEEFLQIIKTRSIPIAIVTTASAKEIERAREELEGFSSFPFVSRDDVNHLKPHPEPVLKGLEMIGGDPDHAVFVGDFRSDIEAGKAAGLMTIGLTGFYPELSENNLRRAEPNLIVQFLHDLIDRIIL